MAVHGDVTGHTDTVPRHILTGVLATGAVRQAVPLVLTSESWVARLPRRPRPRRVLAGTPQSPPPPAGRGLTAGLAALALCCPCLGILTKEPARSVLTGPHKWCSRSHHRVTEWPAALPVGWGSKLKAGPVPQAKLGTWAWEEGGTEASEAGVSALPGPMAVGELVGSGQVAPGARSTGPDRETVSPSAREPGSRHLPECSSLPMNTGVTHGHAGDPRPGRPGQEAARLP